MAHLRTPGVSLEQELLWQPAPALRTGVPVFLGLVGELELDDFERRLQQRGQTGRRSGDGLAPQFMRRPETRSTPALLSTVAVQRRTGRRPQALREATQGSDPTLAERSILLAHLGPDIPLHEVAEMDLPDFTDWPQFLAAYGGLTEAAYLDHAVHGFFENDGSVCYVQMVVYPGAVEDALTFGLESLEAYDDFDLVCVPDIMRWGKEDPALAVRLQQAVLRHCEQMGNRFALLDALPGGDSARVQAQRQQLVSQSGALYFPWVKLPGGASGHDWYPPCGHVAGIYARSDANTGIHKAPANEVLAGVVDLEVVLSDAGQGPLNAAGINCLRAFPRRGIRVWGARTLWGDAAGGDGQGSTRWRYVNVVRVFLTATRWIERNLSSVVFEAQTPRLWARIERDLTVYFTGLLERGAFPGRSGAAAFYVKCDAETNPPEVQEQGMVVTEIGLTAATPAEFIVIRILHGPTGAAIVESERSV